jgi:proline dehydrogenase
MKSAAASANTRHHRQKNLEEEDKDEEMEFQDAKRALKAIYDHSYSDSSTNKHRKTLYFMYWGYWDITSWRIIKILH